METLGQAKKLKSTDNGTRMTEQCLHAHSRFWSCMVEDILNILTLTQRVFQFVNAMPLQEFDHLYQQLQHPCHHNLSLYQELLSVC